MKRTKKPKLIPNIERLRVTIKAIIDDMEHFNQALWVSPPNSKKYPQPVGDFAWFANQIYGTDSQKKRFTWDKAHGWVGRDILNMDEADYKKLFWGGSTLKDIIEHVDQLDQINKKRIKENEK